MITLQEINDVLVGLMKTEGYFTYPMDDYPCCQSCGCYAVPESYGDNFVFFNLQTYDSCFDTGASFDDDGELGERVISNGARLIQPLHLTWGEGVDVEVVRKAFAAKNMRVTGGDLSQKLVVELRTEVKETDEEIPHQGT